MDKKGKKELVESCFRLNIDDLDCSLFLESDGNRSGTLRLTACQEELNVDYEAISDTLYIKYGDSEQGIEIQRIVAFRGYKTYFVCECGKRRKALYLRTERFQCRVCAELLYVSTRIDRNTANGKIFSDFARLTRIVERREAMPSIWYKNRPTKKFTKLLYDAERFGFNFYATSQWEGMEKIKMMEEAVNFARNGGH